MIRLKRKIIVWKKKDIVEVFLLKFECSYLMCF